VTIIPKQLYKKISRLLQKTVDYYITLLFDTQIYFYSSSWVDNAKIMVFRHQLAEEQMMDYAVSRTRNHKACRVIPHWTWDDNDQIKDVGKQLEIMK